MKRKIKIFVDIAMYICLITLMGYHVTGNLIHEILGTVTFILFIIHNALNIKWYQTILKGKHDLKRNIHIIVNLLLLIDMIGIMISGIILSKNVFGFLNIKSTSFARKLHLCSTAWMMVLVSLHLGLHLNGIIKKLNSKFKKSSFEYVYYLFIIIFVILGIKNIIEQELWKDMFLVREFKYYNYEENSFVFYLKNIVSSLSLGYIFNRLLQIFSKKS